MTELTIYEVLEDSRDDPDRGPKVPPAEGSWVWWRTGQHPQGVWQAMNWEDPAFAKAYQANREEFPIMQDAAHGLSGDFGNYSCHACSYFGDGYPEPGHKTECDGVCRRRGCPDHPTEINPRSEGRQLVLKLTPEEWDWLVSKLEEPPKELPRLRKLFEEHGHG